MEEDSIKFGCYLTVIKGQKYYHIEDGKNPEILLERTAELYIAWETNDMDAFGDSMCF